MHRELTKLSTDFWPLKPPDVRLFRTLYLVDGRGDFDANAFDRFMRLILAGEFTVLERERRAAAANIFCSYILGEFYSQSDNWSVFRGWIMTAAAIGHMIEQTSPKNPALHASFLVAREAGAEALHSLAKECMDDNAFKPKHLEWDEYTRIRNALTLGAWAVSGLLKLENQESGNACIAKIASFLQNGRLAFWGESAFPFICSMVWLLEQRGEVEQSELLLAGWLMAIVKRQQPQSEDAFPDLYTSPEDVLVKLAETVLEDGPKRPKSVHSYCLVPLVLMLVRRDAKEFLAKEWKPLSKIMLSVFEHDAPSGYLEWRCEKGIERDFLLMQPQSYRELDELAAKPAIEKLPFVLREDLHFKLMFLLAFPHRLAWSIIGSLDHEFLKEGGVN
jgi:hypothetical protein